MSKSFEVELNEVLDTYNEEFQQIVDSVVDNVSKETAKKLKETSPKKSGEYASGWTVKKNKEGDAIVYNSKKPQLTHLLEYGHVLIAFGENRGRVPAYPHIKDAADWGIEEFEREVRKKSNAL